MSKSKKTQHYQLDEYLKKLKKKIRQEFNHISLLSFDELNTLRTKTEVEKMYDRLLQFNSDEYKKIAKYVRDWVVKEEFDDKKKRFSESKVVEELLTSYNLTTNYLYYKEAERKELRLLEELYTAIYFLDREAYEKALNKAANYWYTQSAQYGIIVTDGTNLHVMEDMKVKKVKWVTMGDEKVCDECDPRNGVIYDIKDIPKKHYRCRCWLIPVFDK